MSLVSGVSAMMLRKCSEETVRVEFELYAALKVTGDSTRAAIGGRPSSERKPPTALPPPPS